MNTSPVGAAQLYYSVCPSPSGSNLALAGGVESHLAAEGAVIASLRTLPGRSAREAHYTQNHRGLVREGGNVPALWGRSRGVRSRVVGLTWLDHYSAVVSLPGSGVETVRDLRGRRLGLLTRPGSELDQVRAGMLKGYSDALAVAGLRLQDVTLVDLPIHAPIVTDERPAPTLSRSTHTYGSLRAFQGRIVRALLGGEIDAIHLAVHDYELAILLGVHTVVDLRTDVPRAGRFNSAAPITLTVDEAALQSDPETVIRYVAEGVRWARWARQRPSEARARIARDVCVAEELVNDIYDESLFESLEPSLEPWLVDALAGQAAFLRAQDVLPAEVDVQAWVEPTVLARARALLDQQTV